MIERAYAAFNARDIDGALALMSDEVSWPKASEGGTVVGKDEVRAYWTRQWAEFDPHVEPLEIIDLGENRFEVRVHQVVKTLEGAMLFDGEVRHIFTLKDGLIQRMDLAEPSTAFVKH